MAQRKFLTLESSFSSKDVNHSIRLGNRTGSNWGEDSNFPLDKLAEQSAQANHALLTLSHSLKQMAQSQHTTNEMMLNRILELEQKQLLILQTQERTNSLFKSAVETFASALSKRN